MQISTFSKLFRNFRILQCTFLLVNTLKIEQKLFKKKKRTLMTGEKEGMFFPISSLALLLYYSREKTTRVGEEVKKKKGGRKPSDEVTFKYSK